MKQHNTCRFCGCDIDVEREVFARDRLYTGHSCKGNISDQKVVDALSEFKQKESSPRSAEGVKAVGDEGYPPPQGNK